jgi:hypothetical protein
MAEGSSPTNKLYVSLALALQAGAGFDRPLWMAFDSTDMLAYSAATNALTGELSTGGIARGTTTVTLSLATTAIAADTCTAYLSCTPTGSAPIYGAGLFSASTAGNLLAWHRWAGLVTVASTDTIQETINIQEEIGV